MESKIKTQSNLTLDVTIKLTEAQARALVDIVGYGSKSFLEVFYKHMGKHYLQQNEKGLISLFDMIWSELPMHLNKIDAAKRLLDKQRAMPEPELLIPQPSIGKFSLLKHKIVSFFIGKVFRKLLVSGQHKL